VGFKIHPDESRPIGGKSVEIFYSNPLNNKFSRPIILQVISLFFWQKNL